MEKIKLQKQDYKSLMKNYDWNLARDANDKPLFSNQNEFNSSTMEVIFDQFNVIEINENDTVSGVFPNGQKTLIAKAFNIFQVLQDLRETSRPG